MNVNVKNKAEFMFHKSLLSDPTTERVKNIREKWQLSKTFFAWPVFFCKKISNSTLVIGLNEPKHIYIFYESIYNELYVIKSPKS